MDLLDRVNALTDDQLRMIADREDASGVLASYVLAERRGLPMPDRETVILGDGYVIVAQDGKVSKTPIDYFKAVIREGSFVSWNSSGGRARGQVEHIMVDGVLGIPGSEFQINAEPDNPAVLIRVWREGADGWAATETLVGHKMTSLTSIEPLGKSVAKESFEPPEGVQEAAQRALAWIGEGHAGSGFTDVGRARASQLARGDSVSEDTIRRMASFLARHEGDSQAEGFNAGEDGFPSAGRVAWDAWGGDPAVSWTRGIIDRLDRDEKSYSDVVLTPRQKVMYEKYEWVAETFGKWDGGVGGDGAHYIPANDNVFKDEGLRCANCVFFQGGGGCEILNMQVEPEGVCKLWVIPESSLTEPPVDKELSRDNSFLRKQAAQRFTLGPLYVPDFMDAHGEWTDSEELQAGVWEWVRSGDRTIYLQHDREVRAGEWVEVMTMPQPWTVNMSDGAGNNVGQVTYPAGTVFLGVVWDAKAWKQIVAGKLRGYSIGGFSDRVLADLPEDAVREGVELDA